MKIAFTTSDGRTVDQHFGQASAYAIWELEPDRAEFVTMVSPLITGGAPQGAPGAERGSAAWADLDEEDRTTARASAVAGCALVCTVAIGGPAAAKLVARKIHPMKTGAEVPIAEVVSRLQQVLRGTPPPWLKKAMTAGAAPAANEE